MKNVLKLFPIIFVLILLGSACQKNEPLETNPAKIILGKWDLIQSGNTIVDEPVVYKEFFSDSTFNVNYYKSGVRLFRKYWIDSLFNEVEYSEDGNQILLQYSYTFSNDNNQVELILLNFYATNYRFNYKRIN